MLNERQQEVVNTLKGYVRVSSGAGTGKTTTIVKRFLNILDKDDRVEPNEILCVTFTNKAAEEMSIRVQKELGSKVPLSIMTFHSLCLNIIKSSLSEIGLPDSYTINMTDTASLVTDTIMKYGSSADLSDIDLINEVVPYISKYISSIERGYRDIEEEGASDDTDTYIGYMLKPSSELPKLSPLSNVLEAEKRKEAIRKENKKKGIKVEPQRPKDGYVSPTCSWAQHVLNLKRENGILSFDDMLYLAGYIIKNIPEVRKQWQGTFKYIMVDEFQDTDFVQFNLIKTLAEGYHNLCIVGDVNQSIYAFRNAKPSIFMEFETLLNPEEVRAYGYKELFLVENYRSNPNILEVANEIMKITEYGRKSRNLVSGNYFEGAHTSRPIVMYHNTDLAVVKDVLKEILDLQDEGYKLGDMTFLYRAKSSKMLQLLREYLTLNDIPFVDDLGFTAEEQRMRDAIISFFFLVLNPKDTLSMRKFLLSILDDESEVNKLMLKYIKEDSDIENPFERVRKSGYTSLDEGLVDIWYSYYFFERYRDETPSNDLVIALSRVLGYRVSNTVTDSILDIVEDAYDMDELCEVLNRLSLVGSDTHTMDTSVDAVHLMTMHKSKGLEFPVVFVVDVSNGVFPNKRSKGVLADEEMRLAYVAVTRAKERLYLLSSGDKYTVRLSKSPSLPITILCDYHGALNENIDFIGDLLEFTDAVIANINTNEEDYEKALNW